MPSPLDFLRRDDVPFLSRPLFRAERLHTLGWGVFAGMVEGNTSSIVAAKTFGASPLLITIVWSTPMVANVLSLVWGALLPGRARMPLFMSLALASILTFATIGLTPADAGSWAGRVFALQVGLARIFVGAIVNIRTSVWTLNYPREQRATITGRLQSLRFIMTVASAALVGVVFNLGAEHYRWVYPLVALVGGLSVVPLRRVHVRGEREQLARERADSSGVGTWRRFVANLGEARRILRTDRGFAQYCTAQYLLGSANFMVDPVILIVVTTGLGLGYLESAVLMDLIPNVLLILTVPFWSRYFDRRGVLRFRVVNTLFWCGSTVLAATALLLIQFGGQTLIWVGAAVLAASRVFNGFGRGGGSIAWNLGHLHFAPQRNADLYMGIHVALTGLRGLTMPFVAVLLYQWFGWLSLAVSVGLNLLALRQFSRLAKAESASADARALDSGPPSMIEV